MRLKHLVAASAVLALVPLTAAATSHDNNSAHSQESGRHWTAGWAASPQRPSAGFGPNWSEEGFSDQTVRQVVRLTTGGDSVRIHLSNRYGASPLRVTGATIARAGRGAAIVPGTTTRLTVRGRSSFEIPAVTDQVSDPVEFPVKAAESVTVSLYLKDTTGPATFHSQAWTSTYRAEGDHRADNGPAAFTASTKSWYYLSGIDTSARRKRDLVVAFGDSITDGFASTAGANHRYPDLLADRLRAAGRDTAVVNQGIGGNLVVNDSAWYGEKSTNRFRRDVLEQAGVRTVIILEGVNDIGFSESDTPTYKPAPDVSVAELIAGYRQLIRDAHSRGVRVVGATLLPLAGSDHYSAKAAAKQDALNHWIRHSGEFDAVADFDRVLADPKDPERIDPRYDSGDHLHPNDAGYQLMADTIDLRTL
jgi:lysophospholipase L1-like esterase